MRVSSLHALFAAAVTALAASSASAIGAPSGKNLEFPLTIERLAPVYRAQEIGRAFPARSTELNADWSVQVNLVTGTAHMAWGGTLPDPLLSTPSDAAAIGAAQRLLESASAITGVLPSNSEVVDVRSMPGKRAVHFRQIANGLPVHTGRAVVLLTDEGRVAAFGSDFFPETSNLLRSPALSASQAREAAARAIGATPRTDCPMTQDLAYIPEVRDEIYELVLAWRVVFESEQPFGKWESWVDAESGTILSRSNLDYSVNVIGTVQGDVEDVGYCDGVATDVFENLRVNVFGGNNGATDDTGFFDIPHGGTAPVTITAQLRGPWIDVNRPIGLGNDASFAGSATPGTPATINWTNANSRADERDVFFHGNRAHDFIKAIDPTFTDLDFAMPATVGRMDDGICPGVAWSDGLSINFCEAGAGWANFGRIGTVIYHEYGHTLTANIYDTSVYLALHEGNSDILANLIDRQPVIGIGAAQDLCTIGIHSSENELQYPEDQNGEPHHDGQIIAGFVWDAWQAMLAFLPPAEADNAIRQIWHNSRKVGLPLNLPDQVLWSFLVDDDDANLANGTPHHQFLCEGATNHGFDCPAITEGLFITHTPLGSSDNGPAGFDVDAIITSTEAALDPSALLVHYRVNGGSFNDVGMTPSGEPDEYRGHIPALGGNSEVEYYISAADMADNAAASPQNAPSVLYSFDVVHFLDTLEDGAAGWQAGVPGDDATGGIWQHVDPIGTTGAGWQAQPEDDATPAPGVLCWITGQCAPPACPVCTQGCSDVDLGTTTLLSPVYDLSGATLAKLKVARWYSNNTAGAPNTDLWTIDVSNDGGTTWTNAESSTNTIPSPNETAVWTDFEMDLVALFGTPNQVRLRFRARDTGFGSVVEAGIDDLRIFAEFGGGVGVEDVAAGTSPLTIELSQNQPNPFRPMTRIDFAVPMKTDVKLSVYDVAGREVRTLTAGTQEAGRYSAQWDGKDASGSKVSAGVYFYRLVAGAQMLTRKMTVLK